VIILTGRVDIQSEDEGMKSGAFDYMMKPIDIEELTVKIDRAKRKHDKG